MKSDRDKVRGQWGSTKHESGRSPAALSSHLGMRLEMKQSTNCLPWMVFEKATNKWRTHWGEKVRERAGEEW